MNNILLQYFFVICAISFASTVSSNEEVEDRVRSMYARCKEETQIDEDDLEAFRNMELPSSTNGKCMMGCLMREASIILDGKFHKDGALRVAERYYHSSEEDLEKARIVIDICELEVEEITDECEIAAKIASCVVEEAQKIGLASVPSG